MITIPEALLYSLLGILIVFFGLILLMIVIAIQAKLVSSSTKKKDAKQNAASAAPVQEKVKALAPGSAGEIKLYNVSPRTAAMIMAITADKMGVPLNQLRFLSIKCLDE